MFIKNIIDKSSLRDPKLNSSPLVLLVPIDSENTCQDVAGQCADNDPLHMWGLGDGRHQESFDRERGDIGVGGELR